MNYKSADIQKCAITKDMMLNWLCNCYNEHEGDSLDVNNVSLEVKINGKEIDNPLRFFEDIENYIDKNIEEHCKILDSIEDEIDKRASKICDKKLEEKVFDLVSNINNWLENNN